MKKLAVVLGVILYLAVGIQFSMLNYELWKAKTAGGTYHREAVYFTRLSNDAIEDSIFTALFPSAHDDFTLGQGKAVNKLSALNAAMFLPKWVYTYAVAVVWPAKIAWNIVLLVLMGVLIPIAVTAFAVLYSAALLFMV